MINSSEVSWDTLSQFYVNSFITGYTNPVQKLVSLTVKNCVAINCQLWLSSSTTSCSKWKSDFKLYNNEWIEITSIATALDTTTHVVIGFTLSTAVVSNTVNVSSFSSFWWWSIKSNSYFYFHLLERIFLEIYLQL